MKYFSLDIFTDRSGRLWFNPDKYETITCTLEASLEPLTAELIAAEGSVSELVSELVPLTCVIDASFTPAEIHATLDGALQEFVYTSQGTFIENYIRSTLEKLLCEGYANMGLEASLELFSCNMQSLFGASISATLEEIDLIADGNSTYVSLEPLFKRLTGEMFSGIDLDIEFEVFQGSGRAFIEVQGDMEAHIQRLTFESYSGQALIAKLMPIGFSGSASTPIFGTLNIRSANFTCSMSATTHSVNSLLADLRKLTLRASGTSEGVGGANQLLGTLKKHQAVLTGINGRVADLEGEFKNFLADFHATPEEINNLEAILKELTMTAISFTGTGIGDPGDCEPVATLEFGA